MSLGGLIKELFPTMGVKDVSKIVLNYGGAVKDIIEAFLQDQIPHLDKLKNIEDSKCSICGRSKKETWFVNLRGKRICCSCAADAIVLLGGVMCQDDISGIEGNTESLKEFKEFYRDCDCEDCVTKRNSTDESRNDDPGEDDSDKSKGCYDISGVLRDMVKEGELKVSDFENLNSEEFKDAVIKAVNRLGINIGPNNPIPMQLKVEDDVIWANIASIVDFFLSDAIPPNADIEYGAMVLQELLKKIRNKIKTEKA